MSKYLVEIAKSLLGSRNSSVSQSINFNQNPLLSEEKSKDEKEKEIRKELGLKEIGEMTQPEFREDQLELVRKLTNLIVKKNFLLLAEKKSPEQEKVEDQLNALVEEIAIQRKPEVAIKIFDKVLETGSSAEIYNGRSKAHTYLGRHEEALRDFQLAAENGFKFTNRDCQRVEDSRVFLRDHELLDHESFLKQIDRLISLIPDSSVLHGARGNTYEMMGQNDKAMEDFDRAIDLNPTETWRNFEKAKLLMVMGRLEEGLEFFRKEKDLQSLDNPNRNSLAWRDAVKFMANICYELGKQEALDLFEELRANSADQVIAKDAERMVERIKEEQRDKKIMQIRPRSKKSLELRKNLVGDRGQLTTKINSGVLSSDDLEKIFFDRAELDDRLIAISEEVADSEGIQNFAAQADADFSHLQSSQAALWHCRNMIRDSYANNDFNKARRWCKRSEFLETSDVKDALADLRGIKSKLSDGEDLQNEDYPKVESAYSTLHFSHNDVRFEQIISEISHVKNKKHGEYFDYWLARSSYDLEMYDIAEKISKNALESLGKKGELPANFTSMQDDLIQKINNLQSNINFDSASQSEQWKKSGEIYLAILGAMACVPVLIICSLKLDGIREHSDESVIQKAVEDAFDSNLLPFDRDKLPEIFSKMSDKVIEVLLKNSANDKSEIEEKVKSTLLEVMMENVEKGEGKMIAQVSRDIVENLPAKTLKNLGVKKFTTKDSDKLKIV